MRKLKYILDNSDECKGKCELVLLSGTDTNKIADVVVRIHKDTNVEMQVDAH